MEDMGHPVTKFGHGITGIADDLGFKFKDGSIVGAGMFPIYGPGYRILGHDVINKIELFAGNRSKGLEGSTIKFSQTILSDASFESKAREHSSYAKIEDKTLPVIGEVDTPQCKDCKAEACSKNGVIVCSIASLPQIIKMAIKERWLCRG